MEIISAFILTGHYMQLTLSRSCLSNLTNPSYRRYMSKNKHHLLFNLHKKTDLVFNLYILLATSSNFFLNCLTKYGVITETNFFSYIGKNESFILRSRAARSNLKSTIIINHRLTHIYV
jgi:hypothetical protein